MTDNVENIMLEHLKAIRAELAETRERDKEILRRLAMIEASQATTIRHIGHLADKRVVITQRDRPLSN